MEAKSAFFTTKPTLEDFAISATELGQGNYSTVCKAVHKSTGRHFALKCIDRAVVKRLSLRHENLYREILQEKQANARLGGTWVCRLHTTWSDASSMYLLYDLAPLGELWSTLLMLPLLPGVLMPRVPCTLDERACASICRVLVHALAHTHAQGIAHRDVKPENIVLGEWTTGMAIAPSTATTGNGEGESLHTAAWPFPTPTLMRLVDLGSSKDVVLTEHNNPASDHAGTPEYMSPEAIRACEQPLDSAADLWSLGATVYRLAAGCTPFAGRSPFIAMHRAAMHSGAVYCMHSADPPPPLHGVGSLDGLLFPPGLTSELRAFVCALLQPNPEARLGVTSRWTGVEQDRWLSESGGKHAPCDGLGGRPPGWAVSQEVRDRAGLLVGQTGENSRGDRPRPRGPPGRSTSRILPPVTSPCCLRHEACEDHAWLQGEGQGGPPSPLVPAQIAEPRHAMLLHLAQQAANAPFLAQEELRDAMRHPPPSTLCHSDPRCSAWRSLRTRFQSLSELDRACLAHSLALRYRLAMPHVWCLLWRTFAVARCARMLVLESGVCGPCSGRSGGDTTSLQYRQIGPHGPREALSWGCAPELYVCKEEGEALALLPRAAVDGGGEDPPPHRPRELNSLGWASVESSAWTGPGYCVILPHPVHVGEEEGDGQWQARVAAFVSAVNCLRPPPAALLVCGQSGGPLAVHRPQEHIDTTVYTGLDSEPSDLAVLLAQISPASCSTVIFACPVPNVPWHGCEGEGAWLAGRADAAYGGTVRGIQLLMVRPDAIQSLVHSGRPSDPSHSAWLADTVQSSSSTCQHTLLVCSEEEEGGMAALQGFVAGGNVRYVVCPASSSSPPLSVPFTSLLTSEGEGPSWRALRRSEVQRLEGKGAKCISWPGLKHLVTQDGENGSYTVAVPIIKCGQVRVQPGYATVRVGQSAGNLVEMETVEVHALH